MKGNLFEGVPVALPEEFFEEIYSQEGLKIERIVSSGHITPEGEWYDQAWSEWVVLLEGKASLRLEEQNERVDLNPGDHIMLPAHCRHRVEWTTPDSETVWLAVHFSSAQLL